MVVVMIGCMSYLVCRRYGICESEEFSTAAELPRKWTARKNAVQKQLDATKTFGFDNSEGVEDIQYLATQFSTASGVPVVFPLTDDDTTFASVNPCDGEPNRENRMVEGHHWRTNV
jgi:hypothetical protein